MCGVVRYKYRRFKRRNPTCTVLLHCVIVLIIIIMDPNINTCVYYCTCIHVYNCIVGVVKHTNNSQFIKILFHYYCGCS